MHDCCVSSTVCFSYVFELTLQLCRIHFPLPLHAVRYPVDKMQDFVKRLHAAGQRWIPITDAGVAAAEGYGAYEKGLAMDVFVKDNRGQPYLGQVSDYQYLLFSFWLQIQQCSLLKLICQIRLNKPIFFFFDKVVNVSAILSRCSATVAYIGVWLMHCSRCGLC